MKMLVPALANKDKKKKKTKEAQGDLHPEETSGAMFGENEAASSGEEDEEDDEEEEEEVENPPPKGKKRAASIDPEDGAPKRVRVSLSDNSDSGTEAVPKHRSRTKPLAES